MDIAIILTTYNRVNVTLKCLKSIFSVDFKSYGHNMDIFLTDDNSKDKTFEFVQKYFPSVHTYKTDGNQFWGRGMLHSWEKAMQHKEYDAYIWINDDNELFENAFKELFECAHVSEWKSIICGCFQSKEGIFTYGGYNQRHNKIIPNGYMQEIVYMNGNFVLIPSHVVKIVGLLDWHFHHIGGDFDYGLMARKHGLKIYSTRCYIGISERNPIGDNRGRILGHTMMQRINDLYNCPFIENPDQKWYENRKHGKPLFKCILIYIKMHILIILPDSIYLKLRSRNN